MQNNPFNLMYGRIPNQSFVDRSFIVNNIFDVFNSDNPTTMSFVITGVRGCGKTVILRDIANKFSKQDDWLTIDLNFGSDLVTSFADKLFHAGNKHKLFLDWKLSINASAISLSVSNSKETINNPEIILEELLKKTKNHKKVLVMIDEVNNTKEMRYFSNVYQSLIGRGYDVFLLMTGLENNITSLFNNKATSFLSRTPKIKLGPLDTKEIANKYHEYLAKDLDQSIYLAKLTKGYAFAYQVLGYYLFESNGESLEKTLDKFDNYMRNNGYDVIFNDLSATERKFCFALADSDDCTTEAILKNTDMKTSNFNKYRLILIEKGIIESTGYGKLDFTLPRFKEFIDYVKTYK